MMRHFRLFFPLVLSSLYVVASPRAQDQPTAPMPQPGRGADLAKGHLAALTDEDVLTMVKAGLGADIIAAKIQASECTFDTSPNTLGELKTAGVPDPVILAMVTWHVAPIVPDESGPAVPMAALGTYAITTEGNPYEVVKSSSNVITGHWGMKDTTYSEVGNHVADALSSTLSRISLTRVDKLEAACCTVSIRVIKVDLHNSRFGYYTKDKVTLAVRLDVADSTGRTIYTKQYDAQRAAGGNNGAYRQLPEACSDLAVKASADEALVRALRTGKP